MDGFGDTLTASLIGLVPALAGIAHGRSLCRIAAKLAELFFQFRLVRHATGGTGMDEGAGDVFEIAHLRAEYKRSARRGRIDRRLPPGVGWQALADEDDIGDLGELAEFPCRVGEVDRHAALRI